MPSYRNNVPAFLRLCLVWWAGVGLAGAASLDTNFLQTTFTSVGSYITGIAWAPDGSDRLFVIHKGGEIRIVKNGVTLPQPFAIVSPVFWSGSVVGEAGLVGICFDPNFAFNGYLYVFATVSSTEQHIIRYTAIGDVGTNKAVLISGLPRGPTDHHGGGIGIGSDAKLYWAIGDNEVSASVMTNLNSLNTKVSRANLDGGVPVDNPFVDGPDGNNDYVWARGFRNPFTLAFQPETGALWVSSVGHVYEQIFHVNAGDDAGWPSYENNQTNSFLPPKIAYAAHRDDTRTISSAVRTNNIVTFTTSFAHNLRQGGKVTVSNMSFADSGFHGTFYIASVPGPTRFTVVQTGPDAASSSLGRETPLAQGSCVTGGCFYDSTAVPPAYRGNFFYGDHVSGRIMRATFNASNEVASVDHFATGLADLVDAAIGPDGALYCANHMNGTVYRFAFTNFVTQQIAVTPTVVRMMECGVAAVTVCLAMQPSNTVDVNVVRTSGDTDIAVTEGVVLTFGQTNWFVPQVVRLEAACDGDTADDIATLTISATDVSSEAVTVHVVDVPAEPFWLGPLTLETGTEPGTMNVILNGQPGRTYVLEGNTNLLLNFWTPFSTNTLNTSSTNVLDPESTSLPLRFYRGRMSP